MGSLSAAGCLVMNVRIGTYSILCRACMHSFFINCQSLRELRITSVLMITAIQKEMWVGSSVTALWIFSQREGISNPTHAFSRPAPPPPPHQASSPLLGNHPPPKAPLLWRRGHLRLWGSERGVLSIEGWPIRYDSRLWHIWWVRAVREYGGSTGGRRWPTAAPPPPHPGSLVVPGQGLETNRGWGGGEEMAWVYTWSSYAQLVPERRLQHTQDFLDVTWTVSSFYINSCEFKDWGKSKGNMIIGWAL